MMKAGLKYMHITKTGGTSIENVGKEKNVLWGMYDQDYLSQFKRTRFAETPAVWHVPLRYFERNPYEGNPLFTVIRHPYDRIISEFNCPHVGCQKPGVTKRDFNKWIRDKIKEDHPTCHFLPYHLYIYDEAGNKLIENFIFFDNLQSEFDDLMRKYDLPLSLTRHDNKKMKLNNFKRGDLSERTKKRLQIYYEQDFEDFKFATEMKKKWYFLGT